jgi:hypothetical protein
VRALKALSYWNIYPKSRVVKKEIYPANVKRNILIADGKYLKFNVMKEYENR